MKHVPNFITLLNLFFGCLAIVFALQTDAIIIYSNDNISSTFNIPERLVWASICIGIAAVIDFLDGFAARLFNASSSLGKQLDSLSDVVSFGVAPSVIMYQLLRFSYAREEKGLEISILFLLPAFLIACCSAYRLAKFNMDESQSVNFKGVPTPAIGLLIASFPLILHYGNSSLNISAILLSKWILYALIIILSGLMISNIPVMGLKFSNYKLKDNLPKVILVGVSIAAAILLHWLAVPAVFLCYILLSLIYKPT